MRERRGSEGVRRPVTIERPAGIGLFNVDIIGKRLTSPDLTLVDRPSLDRVRARLHHIA